MAIKNLTINDKDFKISYEIFNKDKTEDIIFLHGWGSNRRIMKQGFFKHLKEFRHIYIDMAGFGNSSNDYVLTTNNYKEIVTEFLDSLKSKPKTIIGHSFGGKVATLLNPEQLVLLSSAGIVPNKSLKIKFKIYLFKFLKSFNGGYNLYKKFASDDVKDMKQNMYETFKNVVDEDFTEQFKIFKNKSLIFWGDKDLATPLTSGELISKLIENNKFYKLDGDHYFFLTKGEFISKEIEKFYKGDLVD